MVAVIASRLCDMEIKGGTLKLLFTLQRRSSFYNCKLLCGMKYLLIFTLGEVVLILACGQIFHFTRAIASRPDHIEFHLDICCRYRGPYCTANPITDVRQSTYASDRRTRGFVSWTVFHVFSGSGIRLYSGVTLGMFAPL